MRHQARPAVLGVDPQLVMVIELGAPVASDEFRRAGLQVLDAADKAVVVAFADDPQMAGFLQRLDECAGGVLPGQTNEPYAAFVDAIDAVRAFGPDDRITEALGEIISRTAPDAELRLDVELWHPDDRALADEWTGLLRNAVAAAGGRVTDAYTSDQAGVILARAYAPAGRIRELAALDVIARLDVLPRPALTPPQLFALDLDHLPTVDPPSPTAPIVGLVDSGIASGHPLIGPAVLAAEALSRDITDGEDRNGHGTMVAGLLLHGPIEPVISGGVRARPICKLLSVAVLNENSLFPDEHLWERDLIEAVEWCASQGARIINLSVGDSRRPLRTSRQLPAAALIDEAARRLGVVVIIAAGNTHPTDYLGTIQLNNLGDYPAALLNDAATGVLDPGTAALALTVGGITDAAAAGGYGGRETVTRRPFGEPGWPSPVTRRGPGVSASVKPELVERAGTLGLESGAIVSDPELSVVSSLLRPGRLLGFEIGTSFAAPLVTRVVPAVQARYPDFGPNLTRALVLLSADGNTFEEQIDGTPAVRRDRARKLLGYGRPSIARAAESSSHRVTLIAEGVIPINGVHIYEIPMPSSFFQSGGRRGINVALAFDPRTRQSRLDYTSSKMEFLLYRGIPLDVVAVLVARIEGEDVDLEGGEDVDGLEASTRTGSGGPGSQAVKLQPSNTIRRRWTNQLGRVEFAHKLDPTRHAPTFLAVRNVNRWDDTTATQNYGLAITLWRTEDQPELYAELEAQLEVVLEIPTQVELETESRL
ncbi:MAG: S8 family peptidase [Acidimicrobiales bacterium]